MTSPRPALAACLLALALSACAAAQQPPAPADAAAPAAHAQTANAPTNAPAAEAPAAEAPAIDRAEVQTVRSIVQTLASEAYAGRSPGDAGLDKARDDLRDRFKKLGLEPVFNDKYVQPFEVAMGAKVAEKALRLGDHRVPDDQYTTPGFGGDGAFDAEAVFVGYGVADKDSGYDSFAALGDDALKGRVAVIYRYEPMDDNDRSRISESGRWSPHAHLVRKVEAVADRGAVAALIVNPPSHADAQLHRAASSLGGRAKIPTLMAPQSLFQRLLKEAGVDNPRQTARRLQDAADRVGDDDAPPARALDLKLSGKVKLDADLATAHNVAALAPGAGRLKDELVVVGAHYDHVGRGAYGSRSREDAIHPGADDNASGTAAVLLLAQRHAERIAAGDAPAPRRSVLFIGFSAEERGLIGSRYFVGHLEQAGIDADHIVAMLNFDMVGRLRDDKLSVFGVKSGKGWEPMLERAAKAERLQLAMSGGGLGPSDHSNFYNVGVPVIHFFSGFHDDYHTPRDTADKINPRGIVRIANLAQRLIDDLAAEPEPALAYVAPDQGGARRGRMADARGADDGERAFLGIVPDYRADGATVASVIDDAPADKAGLKPGDRLTHWDGKPVDDLRRLMAMLQNADPGDTAKLTLERDGEKIQLPVKLGER